MASKAQIRKELKLLAGRVNPVMCEHCDAWVVLGVRAGDHGLTLNVKVFPTHDLQERLENDILTMAAEIVKKRLPDGPQK